MWDFCNTSLRLKLVACKSAVASKMESKLSRLLCVCVCVYVCVCCLRLCGLLGDKGRNACNGYLAANELLAVCYSLLREAI